jgi:hypothetical protein
MRRLLFTLGLLAGCGERVVRGSDGPVVTVMDSLVLAQPDSTESFLSLRTHARTNSGELLLETGTAVLQFDPTGALRRVIGREGRGPGEFVRISSIGLLPGDSLFAAVDARRARIVVFGVEDGELRREVVLTSPIFADQQWVPVGDTIVMPAKLAKQAFTSWVTTTDSIWKWGTAPAIIDSSIRAYSQGGEPSVAEHRDGWLALFPADSSLHLLNRDGSLRGFVTLPVKRRLGVPPQLAQRVDEIAKSDTFRFAASLVLANRRLSSGEYLLMHLDTDTELNRSVNDPSSGGVGILYSNMRYWVSLLSADLSRACVDGLVPIDVENVLSPFFRGDTLHFVARRVDDAGQLRSVLYTYRVSGENCNWIPTGGMRLAP